MAKAALQGTGNHRETELTKKPIARPGGYEGREEAQMASVVALHKNVGWKHVQMNDVMKLQKSWVWENQEYRVDAFFGTLCDGGSTPVVIMNVYQQGAGVNQVIDDNCDVWNNVFTSTTKDEGNEYYKYLKKHGFQKV